MEPINNHEFGIFLSKLRKEKSMTQKQLAEILLVSDKAVSKWERGLSFPDITLLSPLANIFEISITELLEGKRIHDVETALVNRSEAVPRKLISSFKEKLFIGQKENINSSYKKPLIFICTSLLSTIFIILCTFTLLNMFVNSKRNISGHAIIFTIAILLIINIIMLFVIIREGYKYSFSYIISSPIFIVSVFFLAKLISTLRSLDLSIESEMHYYILNEILYPYLLVSAVSIAIIVFGLYRINVHKVQK